MSESVAVTAENLNSVMDFDRVIRVNVDGTVSFADDENPYFEIYMEQTSEDVWEAWETLPEGWALMTGYTGQYGYNGPHMHSSEFIGGRMARDILDAPGLYVALTVETDCGYLEDTCDDEDGCQCGPESWVVAYKLEV